VKPAALPRNDPFPASALPFLTMLLLVVVSLMPLRIPSYASVTPEFALMGVFHWTVYRPALLPPVVLFLIGVAFDLVTGAPLGLTSLLFLVTRGVVLRQRQFFVGRQFAFVWFGFTVTAAGVVLLAWLVGSTFNAVFLDLRPVLLQWVLTVAFYPAVSWCLQRLQRLFLA
jgi:rod shape-determining protein MreD